MKIHIKTFGCTANKADSLYIKKKLTGTGHTFTDNANSAGIVIVNTCIVTHTTERKVLKFIRSLFGSGKRIIIAGCLPAAQPDILKGIDCELITPSSLDNIIEMVGGGDTTDQLPVLEGVIGICSISRGCAGDCSYCIVKLARGELISRPVPEITKEIGLLLQQGAKEIQLASQDTAAYGLDSGVRLPELLKAISGFDGDHMIRIGMMNPFTLLDILDDVIESFRDPHIYKFLHIPVQSGSNRVLEHMNRRYTIEEFKYIVHAFRTKFPQLTLSTDFITGYPSETEQDFNDTMELFKEVEPHKVNITRYSPRPGTKALLLYDMPDWIKKERSRLLTRQHFAINNRLFAKKIGDTARVLTTGTGRNNSTVCRDKNYNIIILQEDLPSGNWYDVTITGSRTVYLIGERIPR